MAARSEKIGRETKNNAEKNSGNRDEESWLERLDKCKTMSERQTGSENDETVGIILTPCAQGMFHKPVKQKLLVSV